MRPLLFSYYLCFFVLCLSGQNFDSVCLQQKHVLARLKAEHFSPPEFDARTNEGVLDLFLREADRKNTLFIEADRRELLYTVNNSPQSFVHCLLIQQTYSLVARRLLQLDSMLLLTERTPLIFRKSDTITFSSVNEPPQLCSSLEALHDRIQRRIKYECLSEITAPGKDLSARQEPAGLSITEMSEAIKMRSLRRLRRYLEEFRGDKMLRHLGDCMSNALALRCDPHSNFFNQHTLEDYQGSLYTQEISFGFSAEEDEYGNIVISSITPGGPAWKSNQLEEKDVIVSFRHGDTGTPEQDYNGLSEFYEQISRIPGQTIILTIRDSKQQVREVKLEKEKIESLENTLTTCVVKKDGKKIAYISIPSFYLAEDTGSGRGCANDVAKELVSMQQDSIEGLVIDLRYNGGGALREAVELAGLFVDEGPLAVFKGRGEAPFLLKDMHRGTVYDGPMLVLVNAASASASEFFAGAMKDYRRAVIAGSATFGKTTAQNIVPADSAYTGHNQGFPAFGVLKITTGKFYRLNGSSSQASGLSPDIEIPGLVENVLDRESGLPYHLKRDTVSKKPAFAAAQLPLLDELKKRSEARLQQHPQFVKIRNLGDSLLCARRQSEKVALSYTSLKRYKLKQNLFNLDLIEAFSAGNTDTISLINLPASHDLMAVNDFRRRYHEQAMNTLKKDLIFHESINIIYDLISLGH